MKRGNALRINDLRLGQKSPNRVVCEKRCEMGAAVWDKNVPLGSKNDVAIVLGAILQH